MSILEKLPDDPQREIELLRELVKAKDALIAELSKRPISSPPVYVPYPACPASPPVYPAPWADPWRLTTSGTTSGWITVNGDAVGGKTVYRNGAEMTWGALMPK